MRALTMLLLSALAGFYLFCIVAFAYNIVLVLR